MADTAQNPSSWSDIVELAAERFAGIVDQAVNSLHDIIDTGRCIVGCAEAGLLIPTENPNELRFLVSANSRPEISDIVTTITVPTDGSLVGCVFNTGQMVAVANPDSFYDKVDQRTGLKTMVYMAIPIMNMDGDVLGVATFLNRPDGEAQEPFNEMEIESGMRLADLIASGLRFFQRVSMQQALFHRELTAVAENFVADIRVPDQVEQGTLNEDLPLANAINSLERLSQPDLELAAELLSVLASRSTQTDMTEMDG